MPVKREATQQAMPKPYREQIDTWLDQDFLQLTRIQELLEPQRSVNLVATATTARG